MIDMICATGAILIAASVMFCVGHFVGYDRGVRRPR